MQQKIPGLCEKCFKNNNKVIDKNCKLCVDLKFEEQIFCELNQSVQEGNEFNCESYRSGLFDVSNKQHNDSKMAEKSKSELMCAYFDSEKNQYKKALALQKLSRNEDEIFAECKYHFTWSTNKRKLIFEHPKDFVACLNGALDELDYDLLRGYPNLLWLAPNHIHIYLQTDGTISVEDIVIKLKQLTEDILQSSFKELAQLKIWDDSYYAETLG